MKTSMTMELYRHRELLRLLIFSSLRKSTSGTKLGALWWILDPLLMTVVYVVLVQFIRGGHVPMSYPVFVMCGLVAWKCTATCLTTSTSKMISSERLIKSYSFPIVTLPISSILVNFYLFMVSLVPVLCIALFYERVMGASSVRVSWSVMLLPIVLLPHLMITVGLTLVFCALAVFVQDVINLATHVMRIGWYFSAGLYSITHILPEYEGLLSVQTWTWKHLLLLNPMVHVLEAYRSILIFGRMPDWSAIVVLYVLGAVVLVMGYGMFSRYRNVYAKVL